MEIVLSLDHHREDFYYLHIHNSSKQHIGSVHLWLINGDYWLNNIEIFDPGKNIGKAVIKKVAEKYYPFKVSLSDKNEHDGTATIIDSRYVTEEGMYLMKSCFEKAILNRNNFAYPFPIKSKIYLQPEFNFLENFHSSLMNFLNQISLHIKNK